MNSNPAVITPATTQAHTHIMTTHERRLRALEAHLLQLARAHRYTPREEVLEARFFAVFTAITRYALGRECSCEKFT